jgi:type IV pilus assembly protein PilA
MVFCRGCGTQLHESAPFCPHCGAPQSTATSISGQPIKSQTVAALLCAFLGAIGAHRFYLGNIILGVLYVLFCWTGIPGFIAFVELFIILFTGREVWARKYNNGILSDGPNGAIIALVLIFPMIVFIGILAAIAIPAYRDYTVRARVSEGLSLASSFKTLVAENANNGDRNFADGYASISQTVNVRSLTIDPHDGSITVDMNPNAQSVEFTLIPYDSVTKRRLVPGRVPDGPVMWQCRVSDERFDRYVPSECRI